jgi:hypothetical protein
VCTNPAASAIGLCENCSAPLSHPSRLPASRRPSADLDRRDPARCCDPQSAPERMSFPVSPERIPPTKFPRDPAPTSRPSGARRRSQPAISLSVPPRPTAPFADQKKPRPAFTRAGQCQNLNASCRVPAGTCRLCTWYIAESWGLSHQHCRERSPSASC